MSEQVRRRPRRDVDGERKRVWLNVTMTPELRAEVDEASTRAGLAAGAWVRELVEDTLALADEDF